MVGWEEESLDIGVEVQGMVLEDSKGRPVELTRWRNWDDAY